MTSQDYKKIIEKTKDPIHVCYLVYNVKARTKIPNLRAFTQLFTAWCIRTGGGNGIMRALQIKKNFDKKFGL